MGSETLNILSVSQITCTFGLVNTLEMIDDEDPFKDAHISKILIQVSWQRFCLNLTSYSGFFFNPFRRCASRFHRSIEVNIFKPAREGSCVCPLSNVGQWFSTDGKTQCDSLMIYYSRKYFLEQTKNKETMPSLHFL